MTTVRELRIFKLIISRINIEHFALQRLQMSNTAVLVCLVGIFVGIYLFNTRKPIGPHFQNNLNRTYDYIIGKVNIGNPVYNRHLYNRHVIYMLLLSLLLLLLLMI